MRYDWFGYGPGADLFQCIAISCWAAHRFDRGDLQMIIKQLHNLLRTTPAECKHANTIKHDAMKAAFEVIDLIVEFIDDLAFAVGVYQTSPAAHLENRTLHCA